MSISLPTAELLALCLSTFLYGIFFALVLITTAVMSYGATDDIRRQRTKILPVSYAMLAVATIYVVISWIRGVYGFVDREGVKTIIFFVDISEPTYLVRSCCFCAQSVMGDGIMIWRMYIVYGRRFRIILPAIVLVIAYTVVGIVVLAISTRARPGTDIFHVATTWITVYFSLTMATNVLLSGAIALRIFLAGNPLRDSRPHWLLIFTLIEGCALYTFSVIATLAAFLSGSFGQYAAADSIVPTVGIAFSLIVLQIRFHVSATQGPRSHPSGPVWPQSGSRPAGGEDPNYIRMAVHVSKQTPHVMGRDIYNSSLDMDKPSPV